MQLWSLTQTKSATMLVFMIGGGLFVIAVLAKRLWQAQGEAGEVAAGGQTDRASLLGVALQSLGIAAASGPTRIVGSGPLDGLAEPRTLLTALTIAPAVLMFVWSARTMGANWSIVARTRGDHQLVTGGPFALVRNPIYLAMLLFLLSVAAATDHAPALPIALPLFALGTWVRVRSEERLLRAEFGTAYDAYAARVKRIIPGIL